MSEPVDRLCLRLFATGSLRVLSGKQLRQTSALTSGRSAPLTTAAVWCSDVRRLKLMAAQSAVHFNARFPHANNVPSRANVRRWVPTHEQHVCTTTRKKSASVGEAERIGAVHGRRRQNLRIGESSGDEELKFAMQAESESGRIPLSRIRASQELDAECMEVPHSLSRGLQAHTIRRGITGCCRREEASAQLSLHRVGQKLSDARVGQQFGSPSVWQLSIGHRQRGDDKYPACAKTTSKVWIGPALPPDVHQPIDARGKGHFDVIQSLNVCDRPHSHSVRFGDQSCGQRCAQIRHTRLCTPDPSQDNL